MDQEIIVAGLALVGSLSGTYFANRRATALIAYRLEQLEKKVNQHNSVIERHYELEKKFAGEGRVLIRPSGTEPLVRVMIEGKNQEVIQQEAKQLADLITKVML